MSLLSKKEHKTSKSLAQTRLSRPVTLKPVPSIPGKTMIPEIRPKNQIRVCFEEISIFKKELKKIPNIKSRYNRLFEIKISKDNLSKKITVIYRGSV